MEYDEFDSLEEDGMYAEFGEGFEDDFDALSEKQYEKAFNSAFSEQEDVEADEVKEFLEEDDNTSEDDFEFDSIVGGRDKKPIMSMLNKGKLSKYEMDDLLNQL